MDGELFSAHERIQKAYKTLENSFNYAQKEELENNGFSFLKKHQIQKLLNDKSKK